MQITKKAFASGALTLGLVLSPLAVSSASNAVQVATMVILQTSMIAASMRSIARKIHNSRSWVFDVVILRALSFGECAGTEDFVEGVRAFLEKRPARFA